MRLSLADLNYYRDSLRDIGAQAAEYMRDELEAIVGDAGVTEMREATLRAIEESVGIHGEMAQALAAQLFEEVCDVDAIEAEAFVMLDDVIDFDMAEEKVRYFCKRLVEGDEGAYIDDCSRLAEFYARRCNWESMVHNCRRNHVMYARIPTGMETCDWCMMLASRGFDYYTKEAAEHGSHMNCDCVVVPGGDGATVEGYDPDMLYDEWQGMVNAKASARAKRNGTSFKAERMRIMDGYKGASRRAKAARRLR